LGGRVTHTCGFDRQKNRGKKKKDAIESLENSRRVHCTGEQTRRNTVVVEITSNRGTLWGTTMEQVGERQRGRESSAAGGEGCSGRPGNRLIFTTKPSWGGLKLIKGEKNEIGSKLIRGLVNYYR